MTSIST